MKRDEFALMSRITSEMFRPEGNASNRWTWLLASDGQQVEVAVSSNAANVRPNRGGIIDRRLSMLGGEKRNEGNSIRKSGA
jgi:hypothetical protein